MKSILCALLLVTGCWAEMKKQNYAIQGKLKCGDAVASGVQIMLYDEDVGRHCIGVHPTKL